MDLTSKEVLTERKSKMKIIKPSVELLTNDEELTRLKMIELAGRTCYKSEDKITEDSAVTFAKMLIKRGHEAMLEHVDFCFISDEASFATFEAILVKLNNQLGFVSMLRRTAINKRYIVSGNVRSLS